MSPVRIALIVVAVGCSDGAPGPAALTAPEPGPVVRLEIIAGQGQVDTVARQLPTAITVRARDAGGQSIPGQIVNFVVTEGGGSVFAGSAVTDTGGIASERWTLGTIAGPQRLEVRAVQSEGTPITFAVNATAVAGPVDTVIFDSVFAFFDTETVTVTWRVSDAFGNTITGALVGGQSLSVVGSVVTPSIVGTDSLSLVARGERVGLALVRVFLDPRERGLVERIQCRSLGADGSDSIYLTRTRVPGTWQVDTSQGPDVQLNGREYLMRSVVRDTFVIWWVDGTIDTLPDTRLGEQLISVVPANASGPDTIIFSFANERVVRISPTRWEEQVPTPPCSPIIVEATTP